MSRTTQLHAWDGTVIAVRVTTRTSDPVKIELGNPSDAEVEAAAKLYPKEVEQLGEYLKSARAQDREYARSRIGFGAFK